MDSDLVLTTIQDHVAVLALNRPESLNALSESLMEALTDCLNSCEKNESVHVVILKGNEKAFAAGADIKEMLEKTYPQTYREDFITSSWETLSRCRKPLIACVQGYALGGGCELAMMCDIILASKSARFAQPEATLGTIPGAGGTQRLTKALGKAKAMDLCLSGRLMSASEAEQLGLISRVIEDDKLWDETMALAHHIASLSLPVLMMIKESINTSFETPLKAGLNFERRLFHSTFALKDRKEGMTAFLEKRKPLFCHE